MNPHFRPLVRAICFVAFCLTMVILNADRLLLGSDMTITQKHFGFWMIVLGCLCTFGITICVAVQAKRYGAFKQ